jgi:hypothetical protein
MTNQEAKGTWSKPYLAPYTMANSIGRARAIVAQMANTSQATDPEDLLVQAFFLTA